MLNKMIRLFSGIKVPWTKVRGQSLQDNAIKILMSAAVRHAAAPTQKTKTLMARASSMDRGAISTDHRQAKHRMSGRRHT